MKNFFLYFVLQINFKQKTLVINRKLENNNSLTSTLFFRYYLFIMKAFHNHMLPVVYFNKRANDLTTFPLYWFF